MYCTMGWGLISLSLVSLACRFPADAKPVVNIAGGDAQVTKESLLDRSLTPAIEVEVSSREGSTTARRLCNSADSDRVPKFDRSTSLGNATSGPLSQMARSPLLKLSGADALFGPLLSIGAPFRDHETSAGSHCLVRRCTLHILHAIGRRS